MRNTNMVLNYIYCYGEQELDSWININPLFVVLILNAFL